MVGEHHQTVGSALKGFSECCEVGKTVLILHDDLAVDQREAARSRQLRGRISPLPDCYLIARHLEDVGKR
jgi:hypothetical protein